MVVLMALMHLREEVKTKFIQNFGSMLVANIYLEDLTFCLMFRDVVSLYL